MLVGRDEELRRLKTALAAMAAGHGGTVLITGEAGIGKSRLVREAVAGAGARGAAVLAGRSVAGGVPTPFRPFAEALASAGRAGRLPHGQELDPFRPALGRLVPEWRQPRAVSGDDSLIVLGAAAQGAATTGVLVVPGARLAYEVTGQGPAVVLVHGFGLDMRMWDQQVEHLAPRFRVVRYDCRGFGASGPFDPAIPYTHAGDLAALLDHLAIGQAVLAGLSFGGRVALQAALAWPGPGAGPGAAGRGARRCPLGP